MKIFYWNIKHETKQWLLSIKKKKKTYPKVDYLINIEEKKYYRYIYNLAEELNNNGYTVAFLIFNNIQIEENNKFHYFNIDEFTTREFPKFWTKTYQRTKNYHNLFNKIYYAFKKLNFPNSIVIEGDNINQLIAGYLSMKYKFNSFCMQWGYAGTMVYKIGWRNMPYSKFLSWGNFFSNSYKKQNNNLKIIETGHPLMSKIKTTVTDRNIILFAVPKEMLPFISKTEVILFVKKAIEFSKQCENYKIRLRTHPNFQLTAELQALLTSTANIELHNYFTNSFTESFNKVKYCISISSTIVLEALNYGCIPLYIQINNIPLILHDELKTVLKYNFLIKKHEKIIDIIKQNETNNININNLLELFFHKYDQELIVSILNK